MGEVCTGDLVRLTKDVKDFQAGELVRITGGSNVFGWRICDPDDENRKADVVRRTCFQTTRAEGPSDE